MPKISLKNLKQTHGAQLTENSKLDKIFEKPKNIKSSISMTVSTALEILSMEQLKTIAADLGIFEIDNKSLLIQAIKKELKNYQN